MGNDIAKYKRPITPNHPLSYTIKNYTWLNSIKPPWHTSNPKDYFQSPEEAYNFYISKYTLWGKDRNFFEKIIRQSVLFSKIYLGISEKKLQIIWAKDNYREEIKLAITRGLLNEIKSACLDSKTKLSIVGIPSPKDAIKQIDLSKEYGKYFQDINHDFPKISNFSRSNYDGATTGNHFNKSGHEVFYKYLEAYLKDK